MDSLDFFRNTYHEEKLFFDEGPRVSHVKPLSTINTSSINTNEIDMYRQGVELMTQKHFDAGTIKIHAGEPGHVLRRNRYGMDSKNFRLDPFFQEIDYFDPGLFLKAQDSLRYDVVFTFPIITSDSNQLENYLFDGVIEPLTIRAKASFFSIDVPFESHDVKGSIMDGNTDTTISSDRVLTVDYFDLNENQIGFLDMVDMFNNIPTTGFFQTEKAAMKPFDDKRYPRNTTLSTNYDIAMDEALSLMTGSTDNYIAFNKRSATSGWDYNDSVGTGTDSLTFGGMTY